MGGTRRGTAPAWNVFGRVRTPKRLLSTLTVVVGIALAASALPSWAQTAPASGKKPNIVVIWGDDIGQSNVSAYSHGVMGYRTPNIDRVAREGMMFTDY